MAVDELADKSRVSGSGSDIIYNDLTGIESIKSLIKKYPSRVVDNYMFSVEEQNSIVKTALVVPPIIYGQSRGPVNQRSIQIPGLANATLKRQRGLQIGSGQSRWGNIHIADLSRIFLRLVEKAVEGDEDSNVWGANGLYFTGVGELVSPSMELYFPSQYSDLFGFSLLAKFPGVLLPLHTTCI